MIIASVPHSGSRFVSALLGCKFWHVYSSGESLDEIRKHDLIVAPLRHPLATAQSWKNRGKPIVEHPKHEPMLTMWRTLIDVIDPLKPFYLPLDNGLRDMALFELEQRLGRALHTDWAPITDRLERIELTADERSAVETLAAEPFFKRHGY